MQIRRPLHSQMEELVVAQDDDRDFHAVIAVHSTLLGPAVCSLRYRHYNNEDEALQDATWTAPQATHRAALANIPFGGASAAIFDKSEKKVDREEIFSFMGQLIDTFDGRLIATEDLGTGMQDIDWVKGNTPFACGGSSDSPGDPAYFTALGVLRSIEACVRSEFNTDSLSGLKVAVLGIGHVGFQLCEMLYVAGAEILVADIVTENAKRAEKQLHAKIIRPREIMHQEFDVLCPCAIGSLLDDNTIPNLKCRIIAGRSNNQLVHPNRHSRMLHDRGLVYAPDFAVNAGALYTNACEIDDYDMAHATILVNGIHDTIKRILLQSKEEDKSTYEVAIKMVRDKLRRASAQNITRHL